MDNFYKESWRLYKAQTETFTEDQEYYYQFCKNYTTLEMFAGYGRLANFLSSRNIDLEVVELESQFTKFINIDQSKIHTNDVLKFVSPSQFDRIIAGYNSFCLFTDEIDIKNFFSKVDTLLIPGGYASLNYFHTDFWKKTPIQEFMIDNEKVCCRPNYDLSRVNEGYATWIDEYEFPDSKQSLSIKFQYPVKVYKNIDDLYFYYQHTSLELVDIVKDFGLETGKTSETGWIDYVFRKKG